MRRILYALVGLSLLGAPALAQNSSFTGFVTNAPTATTPFSPSDLVPVIQGGVTKHYGILDITPGMLPDASNATIPAAPNALLGNTTANIYFAKAYGSCTWDSTHDVGACINLAIAAAGANGGGLVIVPAGIFGIANTIVLGDGSTTTLSTVNAVTVAGQGQPFERVGVAGTLGTKGTILKWIGSAGGTMAQVLGPATANDFRNIGFDGSSSADTCLEIKSGRSGDFKNVACANYTGKGFSLTTQSASSGLTDSSNFSTANNVFTQPLAWSGTNGAIAYSLDGYLGDGVTNGKNTTRNYFINPVQGVTGAGSSIGFRLAFADQNVISNLVTVAFGSNDGTACGIKLEGVLTSPSNYKFPQINIFDGQVDLGAGGYGVCSSGSPGSGNKINSYDLLSGAAVPRAPATRFLNFEALSAGDFPTGGFWTQGGQNVQERQFRNRFINSTFARASRGTSFSNPASASYTLDQWKVTYDGTQSATVAQTAFSLGQIEVPYNPRYYLSMAYTAIGGGATFNGLSQYIESVATFSGRRATLSLWMKGSDECSSASITPFIIQRFGTGGSPSVTGQTDGTAFTITSSWARYAYTFSVPTVSGKTLGSNGDDALQVGWFLPISVAAACEIDVALPQFEAGDIDTAFEIRPLQVDELMASRYLRLIGPGQIGSWISATQAQLSVSFGAVNMRTGPTASYLAGATDTLNTPGQGDFTVGTPTVSQANSSAQGVEVTIDGYSGATAFRPAIGKSPFILLSAEY